MACTISGAFDWPSGISLPNSSDHPPHSIVETPIRHQTRDIRYIKARVDNVSFDSKTATCTPAFAQLAKPTPHEFILSYDHLVLAPGCTNNSFGTPGVVEHAFFVRTAGDAKAIQAHVRNCFEMASIPGTSTQDSTHPLVGIPWSGVNETLTFSPNTIQSEHYCTSSS